MRVQISDVAFGGDGVARHEGKVVFIPGTLPGETVDAVVISASKRFSRALPKAVHDPSDVRIESDCPYSLKPSARCALSSYCPGCVYRHVSYSGELAIKKKQLADLFARIARMDAMPPVDAHGPACADRYRNKVTLHVSNERAAGYYAADNTTIIPVSDCRLACEPIAAAIKAAAGEPLEPGTDIILRHTERDGLRKWTGQPPSRPALTEKTFVGEMKVPPSSFAQVNPSMSSQLAERVQNIIRQAAPQNVIDLCCGAGLFAVTAAAAGVPSVFGVETDEAAVNCARENAASIAPGRANFICADAAKGLKTITGAIGTLKQTVIILDPPRRGLDAALIAALTKLDPQLLLYISCAADKLARDTKELIAAGYMLDSAAIFDMFPRTASFETLAVFRKTPL